MQKKRRVKPSLHFLASMAESVRFELTVGRPITSFQDWLLKPLGQLSILQNYITSGEKSQACLRLGAANLLHAQHCLQRRLLLGKHCVGLGQGVPQDGFRPRQGSQAV